eukprot:s143_g38.t1
MISWKKIPRRDSFLLEDSVYATCVLCLLTIILAGLLLCTLHTFGIVASADASRCPQDFLGRYAGCQARQDIKALLSFVLGTLVILSCTGRIQDRGHTRSMVPGAFKLND